MSTVQSNTAVFEDFKINVKLKISALWVAVMFCYVYGDYIQIYVPGIIAQAMKVKETSAVQIEFAVIAIFMAVPSIMIFLSLALKSNINRLLNIGVGIFFIITNILFNLTETWAFYLLLTAIETIISITIVYYAWTWPKTDKSLSDNA